MTETPELTEPVLECDPNGDLNAGAVGWSRRPVHTCNLKGHWSLKRRWDHWWIVGARGAVGITCADLDYARLGAIVVFDFVRKRVVTHDATTSGGITFPVVPSGGPIVLERPELEIAISEEEAPRTTHVVARASTSAGPAIAADVRIDRAAARESLNVLLPLGGKTRFQFTSKQIDLPARGRLSIDGAGVDLGLETAFLDFGRGVWPHKVRWNWGAAAGWQGGKRIGLQLGAQWTDGSGQTENAIFVDGVMHRNWDDLAFAYDPKDLMKPWTIRRKGGVTAGGVDLRFQPVLSSARRMLTARLHLCFGHYSGSIAIAGGERIIVDGLLGWAEDFAGLW